VKDARYNLNNCHVYAPFDALVTNLTISEGAYAHVGRTSSPLIDARTWWAIGNFREGQLVNIKPGMRADVYVLSKPNVRFSGIVDSVGFGVTPDPDVIGKLDKGAGRATDPQLGTPGIPISGSRTGGESGARTFSSRRIGGCDDSCELIMVTAAQSISTTPSSLSWLGELLNTNCHRTG